MMQSQTTIDNFHDDALKDILIRVAKPPNGAADLARAMSICKRVQKFSEDKEVLTEVVFDNLPVSRQFEPFKPDDIAKWNSPEFDYLSLCSKYEPFQQVNGLISKCAQAGHPDAKLILAKIIMVSASQLCHGRKKAENSEVSGEDGASGSQARCDKFIEHSKALSFITHFSTGNLLHVDLVRMFLHRAMHVEVVDMRPYLEDFVGYFLPHGVDAHHQRFLSALDELRRNKTLLLQRGKSLICKKGRKVLLPKKAEGDEQLVDTLDYIALPKDTKSTVPRETLMLHYMLVEAIIQQGIGKASAEGTSSAEHGNIATYRSKLFGYDALDGLLENIRDKIVCGFDAVFSSM